MIPMNPEAIGDPNQTPIVYIGAEAGKALGIRDSSPPSPTPVPDVRELAAQAIWQCGDLYFIGIPWQDLDDPTRNRYLRKADAVLAAVTPVIAEGIAQAIELLDDRGYAMYRSAYDEAAAIARFHSTQPTEEETTNG